MKKTLFMIFAGALMILLCCGFDTSGDITPVDMVYIEEGYSVMGAEYGDLHADSDEKPAHLLYLPGYYMDKYEVTNEDYAVCVNEGVCTEPQETSSSTREDYYTNPTYAKFPVVNVTWEQAEQYCEFVEKRLPTEAEWERAAKGIEDNRRYPWGNSTPKNTNLNTSIVPNDTERVGSYYQGASIYGIYDMLGNVAEWTSDWYAEDYYDNAPVNDPQGPDTGTEKVVRGTAYGMNINEQHLVKRTGMDPESYSSSVGFRCAVGVRDSVSYDGTTETIENDDAERAYISAGNDEGIFLLSEPGSGYDAPLVCVVPNGAVVEILAGPVDINYSGWYQIRTQDGAVGWTIESAVKFFEVMEEEE